MVGKSVPVTWVNSWPFAMAGAMDVSQEVLLMLERNKFVLGVNVLKLQFSPK